MENKNRRENEKKFKMYRKLLLEENQTWEEVVKDQLQWRWRRIEFNKIGYKKWKTKKQKRECEGG